MSNVTPALLLQYALKAYFKMELNTTAKKRAYKPSVSNTHLLFAALLPPEVMAFAAMDDTLFSPSYAYTSASLPNGTQITAHNAIMDAPKAYSHAVTINGTFSFFFNVIFCKL